MKPAYLANFRSLDPETFGALMRHLGFHGAAAYRIVGDLFVQVLAAQTETEWPPATGHELDAERPLGWLKDWSGSVPKKPWPRGTNLYFPEQELQTDRFVIAVLNAPGKRSRGGELSGPLEAIASRLRVWFRESRERDVTVEGGLKEHIRSLGMDLSMLVDHELRTPLAAVAGYADLLRDPATAATPEVVAEFSGIIVGQVGSALEAVDKLSHALYAEGHGVAGESEPFDAAECVREMCDNLKERAFEFVGADGAQRVNVRYLKNTDTRCSVRARRRLFHGAVWEVLKNAVIHARSGKVDVSVYVVDRMLVVDVLDDGLGVSSGSEELIFLRFYQDPNVQARRGKRGLGLGLFLARRITERHLGQLLFLRQRNSSLFRFLWPLDDGRDLDLPIGA